MLELLHVFRFNPHSRNAQCECSGPADSFLSFSQRKPTNPVHLQLSRSILYIHLHQDGERSLENWTWGVSPQLMPSFSQLELPHLTTPYRSKDWEICCGPKRRANDLIISSKAVPNLQKNCASRIPFSKQLRIWSALLIPHPLTSTSMILTSLS